MRTLYLHLGWSKTGTSAIQMQVQNQLSDFRDQGILYPQSLQWPDHSHHPFALAFKGSGVYKGQMTPKEAVDRLDEEFKKSGLESVLISSELSPVYFKNPYFKKYIEQNFDSVKLIYTVRRQSELLLSLFNQLVKDPNVRYRGSIFSLFVQNINWLNFYKVISSWSEFCSFDDMSVIQYGENIVQDFLHLFSIEEDNKNWIKKDVNPSIPARCLPLIQSTKPNLSNLEYKNYISSVVSEASRMPADQDKMVLFSRIEQVAITDFYSNSNSKLSSLFELDHSYFNVRDCKNIMALEIDAISKIIDF